MTGKLEAVANVTMADRAAHAIEGEAATGADGHTHESHCLNCGADLLGPHCHRCGQHAHLHRTMGGFAHDILHGVFHFEGKMWGTLPLLFRRPGELTRRYIHGERTKFVSPMALFLFSVFLMVATFNFVGGPIRGGDDGGIKVVSNPVEARAQLAEERRDAERAVRRLEERRAAAARERRSTAAIDEDLAEARDELDRFATAAAVATSPQPSETGGIRVDPNSGIHAVDEAIRHVAANPELMAYKLQSSAYKFSWALIPISLPFIWLMFFWRREYGMYDHAIFATYSLSAMTLMVIALSILAVFVWTPIIVIALVAIPPWHMYRQLKDAYALSRRGALWRTIFLLGSASGAGMLFFILLVTMQMGH